MGGDDDSRAYLYGITAVTALVSTVRARRRERHEI
jgi:hypothetical protein|tara:strand:+ start:20214 stop:20318 length:105 start_codon:yes stop_codon:yes gene_type:complete